MARSEMMPGPSGDMVRAFYRMTSQVTTGDWLPEHAAHVVASPVTDPDDGSVWVTLDTGQDVQLTRRKVWLYRTYAAPVWVSDAVAAYRAARDAWDALRESGNVVSAGVVAGASGSVVACYQLEADDFRRAYPVPRLADFLRAAGAAQRAPDEVSS